MVKLTILIFHSFSWCRCPECCRFTLRCLLLLAFFCDWYFPMDCQGLDGKWGETKPLFHNTAVLVCCLQDTHFLADGSSFYSLPDYSAYYACSPTKARLGGSSIYIYSSIAHFPITSQTNPQAVTCITIINVRRMIICPLYLPPGYRRLYQSLLNWSLRLTSHALFFFLMQTVYIYIYIYMLWGSDPGDIKGLFFGRLLLNMDIVHWMIVTQHEMMIIQVLSSLVLLCPSRIAPSFRWCCVVNALQHMCIGM